MGQILTVQRSFRMAGSHFRALASLNEGTKTLHAAILAAEQLIVGLRFAKIGKRNAYQSSQSEFSPI